MFACTMVCTKALVNAELKKQSCENSLITQVKVPVHSETCLLQIIGLEGWRHSGDKELYKCWRENKPCEFGTGQMRKRKENSYAYNNHLSPKIRIASCEMNVF